MQYVKREVTSNRLTISVSKTRWEPDRLILNRVTCQTYFVINNSWIHLREAFMNFLDFLCYVLESSHIARIKSCRKFKRLNKMLFKGQQYFFVISITASLHCSNRTNSCLRRQTKNLFLSCKNTRSFHSTILNVDNFLFKFANIL